MSGPERRAQVLAIAAEEFAEHGLHGASTDAIARRAGITRPYVFRMFGTKKALFLELVGAAFERLSDGMREAAGQRSGLDALSSGYVTAASGALLPLAVSALIIATHRRARTSTP